MNRILVGLGQYDAYYKHIKLLRGLKFKVDGSRAELISIPPLELKTMMEKRRDYDPYFYFHQPKWEKS